MTSKAKPKTKKFRSIQSPTEPYPTIPRVDVEEPKVVFSFERVQNGKYCFSKLEDACKAHLSEAMFDRRSQTWKDLQLRSKKQLGTEKIAVSSLPVDLPQFITPDIKDVLSLRYGPNNSKKRILGYRMGVIFYILWIDPKGELYKH